jgi:hypothetical protein
MSIGKYDPKLSQAGFMDLVAALQAQLKTPDTRKLLAGVPPAQREAALQLGAVAKNYVDVVEGRSSPFVVFDSASKPVGFGREAVEFAFSQIVSQEHMEAQAHSALKN